MNIDHDVIIVGGGPAGAACARACADAGVDAVIIEQEVLPRDKICSGILFGQTQVLLQRYFGSMPPDSIYCQPHTIDADDIREWRADGDPVPYVWELSKDGQTFPRQYYNIWRRLFDNWLLERCGAPVQQNSSVKGIRVVDGGVEVKVLRKLSEWVDSSDNMDRRDSLRCRYLIGADGGNSTVRRAIQPTWLQESQDAVVFQTYNRFHDRGSLQEGQWTVFFEPSIGQLLSCVHQKDDFLVLCVGGFRGCNPRRSMEDFKRFLSGRFGTVFESQERSEGCVMHMAPPNLGTGRVLLTGDAAGLMYLNGEGISAAIDGGYRCGAAVARALREGGDVLPLYQDSTGDILAHMQVCMENLHFFVGQ